MFGKEKHSNPLSRIDLISLKKLDKSSGKNCNKSNHIFFWKNDLNQVIQYQLKQLFLINISALAGILL